MAFPEYCTTTEAAKLLKVNRVTIYRWGKAGKITILHFGRTTVISRSQVETLKKQRQKGRKGG